MIDVTPNWDSSGQGEKRSVTLEPDKIPQVQVRIQQHIDHGPAGRRS